MPPAASQAGLDRVQRRARPLSGNEKLITLLGHQGTPALLSRNANGIVQRRAGMLAAVVEWRERHSVCGTYGR